MIKWQVPFDEKGEMVVWSGDPKIKSWKDPYEFTATLKYCGHTRGRSSLQLKWQDTKTKKYYWSSMDMLDRAMEEEGFIGNLCSFNFGFYKAGSSVFIKIL